MGDVISERLKLEDMPKVRWVLILYNALKICNKTEEFLECKLKEIYRNNSIPLKRETPPIPEHTH